jgi:integrase
MAALTFVRPGELRHAEWSEIDFDRQLWIIPPDRMKGRIKHMVPLSQQAMDVLMDLKPKTGAGRYIFPSPRTTSRPMSENAVLSALRRMGYSREEMVGHGFRSMASTNLYELGWKSELVEMQLAHKDPNEVRASYNHAKYLPERTKMMQAWADYLDQLKAGGPG